MRFSIDDSTNPADTRTNLNLIQSLNTIAFVLKKITGQSSWKVPPPVSITELGAKGDKGDKGDTGTQGIQGLKGDKGDKGDAGVQGIQGLKGDTGAQGIQGLKGDKGEPAPLDHTHAITDVSGLQTALNAKAAIDHNHLPEAWQDLSLNTGWVNSGAEYGYATAQCRLIGNLVELKGIIRKSSAFNNVELITILPVGKRPNQIIRFTTWGNAGTSQLLIGPNGALSLISRDSTEISLNLLFGAM